MISKNIQRQHIISALREIDEIGIPENRKSIKYNLKFKVLLKTISGHRMQMKSHLSGRAENQP